MPKRQPFSTRGFLLMLQFTDLQGLIYQMGDQWENTVKPRELGRYLDHSTHVHHIYERKRKWVDYKLENPVIKNSILSKIDLL